MNYIKLIGGHWTLKIPEILREARVMMPGRDDDDIIITVSLVAKSFGQPERKQVSSVFGGNLKKLEEMKVEIYEDFVPILVIGVEDI